MVSVKFLPDVVKRKIDHLSAQIYSDLARMDNVPAALLSDEIRMADLIEVLDLFLDLLDG